LRTLGIRDPGETVVGALVLHAVVVEPPPEPIATIQADAHLEGKPALDPHVPKAETLVEEGVLPVRVSDSARAAA
jgi:hypothetical protein